MTSAIVTAGRFCDPTGGTITIIVQEILTAVIEDDDALTGTVQGDDALTGTVAADTELSATVVDTETLTGTLGADDALAAVLRCDGEVIMADLTVPRGDSKNIQVDVVDSAASPVDLTDAIVRFAVKERVGLPNSEATILKLSYYADELEITNAVGGECVVKILVEDNEATPGDYCWDLDVTRRGALATSAGTWTATAGSEVLQGDGAVDFSSIRTGDIIELAGAQPGNAVSLVITAVDEDALTITCGGYRDFADEAGITHNVYTGDRKTPIGGTYTITADVVS